MPDVVRRRLGVAGVDGLLVGVLGALDISLTCQQFPEAGCG